MSKPDAESSKIEAKLEGACAALDGKKVGDNPYAEKSDNHWYWLKGWANGKAATLRSDLPIARAAGRDITQKGAGE